MKWIKPILNTAQTPVDGNQKGTVPADQEWVFASQHNDKHLMQPPFPVTQKLKKKIVLVNCPN